MVHHKPAQFERLMQAIYDPRDLFLIHVDLKSRLGLRAERTGLMQEVRRIIAGRPNIVLMRSRFTNWGGWSLSRILIDAIGQALRSAIPWQHFINLSGQCHPIKPMTTIRRDLAAYGDRVHVELRLIADLPSDDWHHRMSAMIETPLRAMRLPFRLSPPRDFTITHKGSQWVILPRDFCTWLVRSPLLRRIARYMKRLLLSDELIMQALVTNGPFRDRVAPHYGRAIVWPGPKLLTVDDLPFLQDSQAWFARKFDDERDAAVLDNIASSHASSIELRGSCNPLFDNNAGQ